jgi:hypothetical protein
MSRILSSSVLLSFTFVLLVGCTSKPNPRVSRIVEKFTDREDLVTEFAYDSDARIEKITRTDRGDEKEWEFVWEGSTLVELNLSFFIEGGTRDEDQYKLTWEGDRLVQAERTTDGDDTTTTLEYDTDGQLDELLVEGDGELRSTFDYDDKGALTEITTGDSALALSRDASRLTQIESDFESVEFAFDDEEDRITAYEIDSVGFTVTGTLDYDSEGRVSGVQTEIESASGTVDGREVDFAYDDGDAVGLDMTPKALFPFPYLVDLKGGTPESIDNRLTVPRLVFESF